MVPQHLKPVRTRSKGITKGEDSTYSDCNSSRRYGRRDSLDCAGVASTRSLMTTANSAGPASPLRTPRICSDSSRSQFRRSLVSCVTRREQAGELVEQASTSFDISTSKKGSYAGSVISIGMGYRKRRSNVERNKDEMDRQQHLDGQTCPSAVMQPANV